MEAPPGAVASALSMLSYREKLLAGSWRFLTYFGRDTLLSLWMLQPALAPEVTEQALGSVLERVWLEPGALGPDGQAVELGDVAHEEEIGDYAAWKNQQLSHPPADLRTPRYDYKMIDDDFLLAPLLARLAQTGEPEPAAASKSGATRAATKSKAAKASAGKDGRAGRRPEPPARALETLLGKRRSDGRTFEDAALANLALVLARARPFADDPRPLRQASLDGPRFTGDHVHGVSAFVRVRIADAIEQRSRDAHDVRLDVRLVFAAHAHDDCALFRRVAKQGLHRILAIEVVHDCQRLEHHVVAVLEDGHAAARGHRHHLRRLVLLHRERQQVAAVFEPLVFERQQHSPRVRTATTPINVDGHEWSGL